MGSRNNSSGSSSFGKGVARGAGQNNILDSMMKQKNHVPFDESFIGGMRNFLTRGSNERTRSRSEADYPFRGGFYRR